jgi:hypothetical protein
VEKLVRNYENQQKSSLAILKVIHGEDLGHTD